MAHAPRGRASRAPAGRWRLLVTCALVASLTACAPSATPSVAPSALPTAAPTGTQPAPTPEPAVTPSPAPASWVTLPWVDTTIDLAQNLAETDVYVTSVAGGPEGGVTFARLGEDERFVRLVQRPDGWTLEPVSGLSGTPTALLATSDRYLAITQPVQGEDAQVWYSATGATWNRTGGPVTGVDNVGVVAASGDRLVVCDAFDGHAPVSCRLSPDLGATWQASLTVAQDWYLDGMAPLGEGFIAVASDELARLRVLISADGARWQVLDPDPTIVNAGLSAVELVAHRGRLVLAAHARYDRHPAGAGAALFTSVDGRTWTQLALPAPPPDYWDLTELGDVLVATGINTGPAGWWHQDSVLASRDGLTWHAEHLSPALRDAEELRFGAVGAVAVAAVRISTVSNNSYEAFMRLYAATPIAAPDPGGDIVPVVTPAPNPVGAPAALSFEAATTLEGSVVAATHGHGRFVAVGLLPSEQGYVTAAWTSGDGRTWSPGTPIDAQRHARVQSVIAWAGGFVAGGVMQDEGSLGRRAVFWTSTDGITWSRAPDRAAYDLGSEGEDGPELGVVSVAATADGLLAVARSRTGGVVFASTDGRRWDPIATTGESPNAVVGVGRDVLVVGRLPWDVGTRGYVGAAWYSAGGSVWSEPRPLESGELVAVATDGTRFVAVGPGPAAMVTVDGQGWTWAPDQSTLGDGQMTGVVGAAWGFAAVGVDQCAGATGGPSCGSVWRSTDGLAWSRTTLTGTQARDHNNVAIAAGGGVVVVFLVDRYGEATEVRVARV